MTIPETHHAHEKTPPYELVIFDCDGVLVDSERIANREFALLLKDIGLDFSLQEMFDVFVGNSMTRCIEIITERLGRAPPDDLLDRYHTAIRAALEREVQPVDGIHELLDTLDTTAIPYAVASNGEHAKMHATLGATRLLPRFAGRRFSSADVARPKPAPDLFLYAARQLGVKPDKCIVVEDSPLGVQGACAAGMTVIGYADLISQERLRKAGAHEIITRLSEVPLYLGIAQQ